jgi:AcrR family transcriptional regulator
MLEVGHTHAMTTETLDTPTAARTRNPDGREAAGVDSAKRRQILDGARRVFLAHGFDGASMGEIAKAAGVSKGTLYVYFDSKEALFEALIIEERRSLAEVLFQLDADDPDPRSVLRRLGLSFLQMMVRTEHMSSIRMVIGIVEKFPRFGQSFYEAGPCQGARRLKAYLDAQVKAGRLRIADTELAANHFLDLCQSGILRRVLLTGQAPTPDEMARNVDEAIRVFFAAYGPEPRAG